MDKRFVELIGREGDRFSLAEACLLVAADAYPGLDVNRYLAEIERMAARLRGRLTAQADSEEKLIALNQMLFDELGFAGNAENYYDVRNSYLNEVIDRRCGIPITLAILYMEVGRRAGLALEGVSFPGHFLVRLGVRGGTLVLDPFSAGAPMSEHDLRDLLRRVVAGSGSAGQRSAHAVAAELPLDQFLEPAGRRQILARMLRNLKAIYRENGERPRLLQVLNRVLAVSPDSLGDLRDRGLLYEQMEAFRAALLDLKAYLAGDAEAADAGEIRAKVVELTRVCARLN